MAKTTPGWVSQLHHLLLELIPGGAKKDLSAAQVKKLLATVRPRDTAGKARRRVAAELVSDLERCDNPRAGRCPVRRRPGDQGTRQSRDVAFRYSANKPARVAITSFVDNSRHRSAWAADTYRRAPGT